jgi:hypothetical protein
MFEQNAITVGQISVYASDSTNKTWALRNTAKRTAAEFINLLFSLNINSDKAGWTADV